MDRDRFVNLVTQAAGIDRDGAIKLLRGGARVDRYLMISSVGAEGPPGDDDVFGVYLHCQGAGRRALIAGDRARNDRAAELPSLDDPGSGRVRIDSEPVREKVSRDVAAVLHAVLHEPRSAGHVLRVGAGGDPIEQALANGARRELTYPGAKA